MSPDMIGVLLFVAGAFVGGFIGWAIRSDVALLDAQRAFDEASRGQAIEWRKRAARAGQTNAASSAGQDAADSTRDRT
jgi:hypothetical protein